MGCSSTTDQSNAGVVAKSSQLPKSPVPASSRWSSSSAVRITDRVAQLKSGGQPWNCIWTDLNQLPDSFELVSLGEDSGKVVVGVTSAINKDKCAGVKLTNGCEVDIYSYEGVGLVHTQFTEYTYNSEQWKLKRGDVFRVEISSAKAVTFFKNSRKLYTHEDIGGENLCAFVSLGSEGARVEIKG